MNETANRLNQLFLDLVALDAPSFAERPAADRVIAVLASLGLTVEEDEAAGQIGGNCGNLLCRIPANWALQHAGDQASPASASHSDQAAQVAAARPPLLLSTHLDTVEPCRNKRITLGDDGVFRSDGTTILGADDYAGVAAILEAVHRLKEHPVPHRALELLFSVAEEAHLQGISRFDCNKLQAAEGYVLDTSGAPGIGVVQAPGHNHLVFEITGRAAHAGIAPETGISAITVAACGIAAMKLGRVDEMTTANIGAIAGGGATNIVADRCTVTAECRSLDANRLQEQTQQLCAAMQQAADGAGATLAITRHTSYHPYQVEPEEPVARRFLAACQAVGLESHLKATGGGSDLNVLAYAGLKGMVLSCGMQQVHSTEEFLVAEDLQRLTHLVGALILSEI